MTYKKTIENHHVLAGTIHFFHGNCIVSMEGTSQGKTHYFHGISIVSMTHPLFPWKIRCFCGKSTIQPIYQAFNYTDRHFRQLLGWVQQHGSHTPTTMEQKTIMLQVGEINIYPSGNQTWLAGKSLISRVFNGTSLINDQFSSKPCLTTGGY